MVSMRGGERGCEEKERRRRGVMSVRGGERGKKGEKGEGGAVEW